MVQLTNTELETLKEFLLLVKDELEQLSTECDAVFNSGALELLDEVSSFILPLHEVRDE